MWEFQNHRTRKWVRKMFGKMKKYIFSNGVVGTWNKPSKDEVNADGIENSKEFMMEK